MYRLPCFVLTALNTNGTTNLFNSKVTSNRHQTVWISNIRNERNAQICERFNVNDGEADVS